MALSQSGSGLKTVLLVLGLLHLNPLVESRPIGSYILGLELENNLHPALQRRLLSYLRRIAVQKAVAIFATTHSNVAIDIFATDSNAQLLHVSGLTGATTIRCPSTYVEHNGLLDDLDVRASDLLQANGIVWVEGPSDRLYFNRWITLWSNGQLVERLHYQCVFYGGRLLSHLSAVDPAESAGAVSILSVNRNAILLIDSDRKSSDDVSATKKRLINEVAAINGIAWVTAGKEVENYIPVECLRLLYEHATLAGPDTFADFATYLRVTRDQDEESRFLRNKVLYAELVLPHLTVDNVAGSLDLKERLDEVCDRIRKWNKLPAPS